MAIYANKFHSCFMFDCLIVTRQSSGDWTPISLGYIKFLLSETFSWKVSLGAKSPSITEITTPTKGKPPETNNKKIQKPLHWMLQNFIQFHPVSQVSFPNLTVKKSTDAKLLQHATPLCRSWVDYDIHGSRYHWHHWWRKHRPCSCHCPPTSSLQTKVWKKRKGAWKLILFQQSLEWLTRGHLGMIPHIPRTRQIDPSFVWKGLFSQVPSVYGNINYSWFQNR